ncbi:MAG: hypothetical protein ACKOFJ_04790 [Actinomycetota bacterium]
MRFLRNRTRFATSIVSLSILLLSGHALPLHAAVNDQEERYRVEIPAEDGWHGVNFDRTTGDWAVPSTLFAYLENQTTREFLVCKALDDPSCLKAGWQMKIRALFDACANNSDRDCIASVTAIKPNGERLEAKQKLVLESQHTFVGDSNRLIPDGTGAGIWTIQDGSQSMDYAVVAGMEMRIRDLDPRLIADANMNVVREKMLLAIQPVELSQSGNIKEVAFSVENGAVVGNSSAITNGCFVAANGLCALRKAFANDLTFELSVRYRKGVPGWMAGRIQSFRLVGNSFPTNDGFEMRITGKPVTIGTVVAWSRWENTTPQIRELFAQGVDGFAWRPNRAPENSNLDGNSRTLLTYINEAGSRGLAHFEAWLPLIKDKATSMRTQWSVQSIPTNNDAYDRCSSNLGLIGVVNSNASVYSAGPPTFNRKAGTLEYQVAAPHYTSDGITKHRGTYDLAMRSDVARCLYGFSKAPISAVVSIEGESGSTNISIKTVTERDGILRLNASGFTFSSPKIKVKLTQASAKTKSITCKKGAQKVTVSGANPQCPKGYTKS